MRVLRLIFFLLFCFASQRIYADDLIFLENQSLESMSLENPMVGEADGIKASCFWIDANTLDVYDISSLTDSNDRITTFKDGSILHYNFCANIKTKCKEKESQAAIFYPDSSPCENIAGDSKDFNIWNIVDNFISIKYNSAGSDAKSFIFTLNCGKDKSKDILIVDKTEEINPKDRVIQLNGVSGSGKLLYIIKVAQS